MPLGQKTKELWKNPAYRQHMIDVHLGKKQSEETIRKRVEKLKGQKRTDKHKIAMSIAATGKKHKPQQGFQKGHKITLGNKYLLGKKHTQEWKIQNGLRNRGEKSHFWKGGISTGENKIDYLREQERKRRNRKYNAEGSHTQKQWENLKRFYNYMCLCCKRSEPEIKLTEDHILPLTKGGSDFIENIQPLCQSCNARKYTKFINFISMFELREIKI